MGLRKGRSAAGLILSVCIAFTVVACTVDSERDNRATATNLCPRPACIPIETQKVCGDAPCEEIVRVDSAADLRRELAEWNPDEAPADAWKVIQIQPSAQIELGEIAYDLPLELKARTVLQSTRGGLNPGGLLKLDDYTAITHAPMTEDRGYATVFEVIGEPVLIRNLRLRGPSGATWDSGETCGLPDDTVCPRIIAIDARTEFETTIVDNEIFNWAAAVRVRGSVDTFECQLPPYVPKPHVHIFRNFIHHNRRAGFGYGVTVADNGFAVVEGNTFDWNRHSIADDGSSKSGYFARYNYVLPGATKYGGTIRGYYDQHFDMHGYGGPEKGYGGVAGNVVEIVGNTVHGEQTYYFVKTRPVYRLRGQPCQTHLLRDNVLVHDDADEAMYASDGGEGTVTGLDDNQYDTDTSSDVLVGDFDGDGHDDLFQPTGAAWYYSSGGVTEWRLLQAGRDEGIDQLRLGDFDGDSHADVFKSEDGEWLVSRYGTEPWDRLYRSSLPVSALRFGDFDGDGSTDAFETTGAAWYYYPGAASDRVFLAKSVYDVDDLRFGDFNDDRITDVFGIEGGGWAVSYGGASGWRPLNELLTSDLDSLVVADYNGNGRSDVAQSRPLFASMMEWRVSWEGRSGWDELRKFPADPSASLVKHWIGEFDSKPGSDALRYWPPCPPMPLAEGAYLVRSSGASGEYVRHSLHGMC
jgi:hypothetical protein